MGESAVITFEVQSVPMLRAPAFVDESNQTLTATTKGTLLLNWKPIANAKDYLVELKDSQGKTQSTVVKRTSHQFSKLMPGRYSVSISAIDLNDRVGEKSEVRTVIVPNKTAVKSLKIKKMEVR